MENKALKDFKLIHKARETKSLLGIKVDFKEKTLFIYEDDSGGWRKVTKISSINSKEVEDILKIPNSTYRDYGENMVYASHVLNILMHKINEHEALS